MPLMLPGYALPKTTLPSSTSHAQATTPIAQSKSAGSVSEVNSSSSLSFTQPRSIFAAQGEVVAEENPRETADILLPGFARNPSPPPGPLTGRNDGMPESQSEQHFYARDPRVSDLSLEELKEKCRLNESMLNNQQMMKRLAGGPSKLQYLQRCIQARIEELEHLAQDQVVESMATVGFSDQPPAPRSPTAKERFAAEAFGVSPSGGSIAGISLMESLQLQQRVFQRDEEEARRKHAEAQAHLEQDPNMHERHELRMKGLGGLADYLYPRNAGGDDGEDEEEEDEEAEDDMDFNYEEERDPEAGDQDGMTELGRIYEDSYLRGDSREPDTRRPSPSTIEYGLDDIDEDDGTS